jgi:hypothetical protein
VWNTIMHKSMISGAGVPFLDPSLNEDIFWVCLDTVFHSKHKPWKNSRSKKCKYRRCVSTIHRSAEHQDEYTQKAFTIVSNETRKNSFTEFALYIIRNVKMEDSVYKNITICNCRQEYKTIFSTLYTFIFYTVSVYWQHESVKPAYLI